MKAADAITPLLLCRVADVEQERRELELYGPTPCRMDHDYWRGFFMVHGRGCTCADTTVIVDAKTSDG